MMAIGRHADIDHRQGHVLLCSSPLSKWLRGDRAHAQDTSCSQLCAHVQISHLPYLGPTSQHL